MMALILSSGFRRLDDAIVMLENIVRHMELGRRSPDDRRAHSIAEKFQLHHRVDEPLSLAAVVHPGAGSGAEFWAVCFPRNSPVTICRGRSEVPGVVSVTLSHPNACAAVSCRPSARTRRSWFYKFTERYLDVNAASIRSPPRHGTGCAIVPATMVVFRRGAGSLRTILFSFADSSKGLSSRSDTDPSR